MRSSRPVECAEVRRELLDYQRGRLEPERTAAIRAHVDDCPACAREAAAEDALTDLLERGLPQHPASLAFKRRLAAHWPPAAAPVQARWWRRWPALTPALAVALVLVVGTPLSYEWATRQGGRHTAGMVAEAVNDHLRLVSGHHALEVEAGGIHQVKPWFAGKLDFAPVVAFGGDAEFPLQGGAVEYFLDRKAAVFVYKRRLHTVSLLVFRADGLPWPAGGRRSTRVERGFNVVLWRAGELGYTLVSDLDAQELSELADRLAG
jgi:anti-sigma factor RsiW